MYSCTSFQMSHLSQPYPPERYVLQGWTTIISPALHISMQFIWDVIINVIAIRAFQTYSRHIPSRSYVSKYILPRSHVQPIHVSIISHALHTSMQFIWGAIIKIIAIIGFQTYPKHIPSRSYVSMYILLKSHVRPVHIFIISPTLHTSMQFIWDVIIKKLQS